MTTNTTADIAADQIVGAVTESIAKFLPVTLLLSIVMALVATLNRGGVDLTSLHPVDAQRRLVRVAGNGVRHVHDALGWVTFGVSVGAVLGLALILACG